LGDDGEPVGYDIQHASKKADLVRHLMRQDGCQVRSPCAD
jgi:hypothetical protein